MKRIIEREKIDCDFEKGLSIYAESRYHAFNSVLDEYKISKQMHFQVKLLFEKTLDKVMHTKLFKDAVMTHLVASINPLKYTQNLAAKIKRSGTSMYEKTPLLSINGNIAATPKGMIKFNKKIIIATDSYNHKKTRLIKSTICVTSKLTRKQLVITGLKKGEIIWNAKKDYDYLKLTKDKRLLVGFGNKRISNDDNPVSVSKTQLKEIISFLNRLFPRLNCKIEYVWSGSFSVAKNFLPLIEFQNNKVIVLATSGQPLSTMTAKYVVNKIFNRKSLLDVIFNV